MKKPRPVSNKILQILRKTISPDPARNIPKSELNKSSENNIIRKIRDALYDFAFMLLIPSIINKAIIGAKLNALYTNGAHDIRYITDPDCVVSFIIRNITEVKNREIRMFRVEFFIVNIEFQILSDSKLTIINNRNNFIIIQYGFISFHQHHQSIQQNQID